MINILHIITDNLYYRVCAAFYDNDKVKNYFLLNKELDPMYKRENTIVIQNKEDINIKNVEKIIDTLDISVVIHPFYDNILSKKVKNIYIHHGVWATKILNEFNNELLNKESGVYTIFNNYDLIVVTEPAKNFICKNFKKYNNKIISFNGITQIDYLFNLNFIQKKKNIFDLLNIKFDLNVKVILFCSNNMSVNHGYPQLPKGHIQNLQNNEYITFMNELILFAKKYDYIIISKIYQAGNLHNIIRKNENEKINKIHNNERVFCYNNSDIIFGDFLFADIVIIQSYSTTHLEAMVLDKPIMQAQLEYIEDWMELEKYKNIPQSRNLKEFNEKLQDLHTGNFRTKEYKKERKKYLIDYFGSSKIEKTIEKLYKSL